MNSSKMKLKYNNSNGKIFITIKQNLIQILFLNCKKWIKNGSNMLFFQKNTTIGYKIRCSIILILLIQNRTIQIFYMEWYEKFRIHEHLLHLLQFKYLCNWKILIQYNKILSVNNAHRKKNGELVSFATIKLDQFLSFGSE